MEDKNKIELTELAGIIENITRKQTAYFYSLSSVKNILQGSNPEQKETLIKEMNEISIDTLIEKYATNEELNSNELKLLKKSIEEPLKRLQKLQEKLKYDILPSSSCLYFLNSALTHHGKKKNLDKENSGTKKNDRHKEIKYSQSQSGYSVTQIDKRTGEQIEVVLENADKMQGKGIKKCFAFLLTESNKQNFDSTISFSLEELVDRGMYQSIVSARTGIKNALDALQHIRFGGVVKKGKNKTIKQAEAGVLFYHYKIKNNYVEVSVNENFNIEFIATYYALMPRYLYSLKSGNAFDLGEYIFMQARQNASEIKTNKSFNVSFKKIRELLVLPTENDVVNKRSWKPKQYVIEPILSAIEELQQGSISSNADFVFEAVYNRSYSDLNEFLKGYLKISFDGEIYQNLSKIANKQEKKKVQIDTPKK